MLFRNTVTATLVYITVVAGLLLGAATANNDTYTAIQGQALTIAAPGVLGNDTSSVGNPLTAIKLTNPSNGTVTLNSNGSFTYTPNAGFTGVDTFTYKANDGSDSNAATVTITVNAATKTIWSAQTTPAILNENDGQAIEVGVKFRSSQSGMITGVRFYKGSLNTGTHVGKLWSSSGTLLASVTFTGETASGWQQMNFATPVTIAANTTYVASYYAPRGRYSANASYFTSGVDNPPLRALATGEDGGNGVYRYNTGGGFPTNTYNAANYWVDVVFVSTSTNRVPVAVNDSYTTNQGTALTVASPGLLSNDTDADGNVLTAIKVTNPAHGTVTVNANGGFTYTPAAGFSGPDTFTYKANDGMVDSNTATVTITVNAPVNRAPVAVNDSYTTNQGTPLTVASPGLLSNDTDADGNALTAIKVTNPANGTVTVNANGSFTYTPTAGFSGPDTFTYKANDGIVDSNTATVTVTVNTAANRAPVAVSDSYTTNQGVALTVASPGLLSNDTDADANALTAIKVTNPAHGTVTVNANGGFTYTPTAGYSGADSFTYKANDGTVDSNTATVSITVSAPVNHAPVAVNDSYATKQGQVLTIAAPGVLSNDTDADGNALTVNLLSAPTSGTVTLNPNGSFTYTPNAAFTGTDSFTYAANDGVVASNTATVAITVSTCPCTIWSAQTTPAILNENDPQAVELGVKFRSSLNGTISGVRFYKGATNTGAHVGKLWSSSGTLLASVTFTGETASGWQQMNFATPVTITANTTYIASYYAPNGRYSANANYFTSGVDNAPLRALATGEDGGNGVYRYGSGGGFPANTYNAANYWVDVVFTPSSTAAMLVITAPTQGQTINGTTVNATYTTVGDLAAAGVDHAHFILDSNPVVMDNPMDGAITFSSVPAGSHTLNGFLVRADHTYIPGTDAAPVTFTTVVPDGAPPSVSITSPAAGSTLNGTSTVSATASDNIGVVGVQFLLDGANLGAEDTTSPYSVAWNTALYANGSHVLTARARDASGNATVSAPVSITISNLSDPSTLGQWSAPVNWPIVSVHAALLPTGEVLGYEGVPGIYSGSVNGGYWNPSTGIFTTVPDPSTDLFCSALVALADGRILVVGGHSSPDLGTNEANIFNPSTHSWTRGPSMAYERWYPSATMLPDGRILATAGAAVNALDYVPTPEVYNPVTNAWTKLSAANLSIPTYPHLFVLANGKLAYTGNTEFPSEARTLDVATQVWTTMDPTAVDGGSSVMYAPGKFMKSGSANDTINGQPSAATTFVIDYNSPTPRWQQTASMAFGRTHHNLTLLPDGNVVVTGGTLIKDGSNSSPGVLEAEMWSPLTQTWTTMSRGTIERKYHSIGLLLPNGKVLVAGTGRNSNGLIDQRNYELYSPPYLFKGARPTITSTPATVQYGSSFFVGTPDAANVASVVLMRPGAVTHMINMEQRRVVLTYTQTAGGLTVTAPANSNIAPPGFYMLMLLNANGVPSVGSFLRFPAPYEDLQAPTAPANLIATGGVGTAALTWTAATDNNGVARYNIHRSTTSGFTPSPANRVGQSSSASYTDMGLTSGRYYYLVTAEDGNANVGPPSNEAVADVTSDTTPPTVSLTSPAAGATLANDATLTATANDNVGIAGVTFLVDGTVIGSEDTTPPYSVSWNTFSVLNGSHQLTARARDTGGNLTTSAAVSVVVNNTSVPGLVAAFAFNEASGNIATDASGNENNGTIGGVTRVPGKFGSALSFNGTNGLVTISNSNSLTLTTGMTLEAWINPSANSNWRCVITKETTGDNVWAIYSGSNSATSGFWAQVNNQTFSATSSIVPLNTWTHVAATFDGSTLRFYKNGILAMSQPASGSLTVTPNAIYIGGNTVFGEFFSGLIDEVRIYNRALTATEIQTDMNTAIQ